MLRGYRRFIVAACGLICAAGASAYSANSDQINHEPQRRAQSQQRTAANAAAETRGADRENQIQPDCGTAKECRAEQRDKDDLIAQQTAAEAAVSQRNAAWWQTGVGAAGVVLLILTVIYTHLATKAAIDSVNVVRVVEGARPATVSDPHLCNTDGTTTTFMLGLINTGRTPAVLVEICSQGASTDRYADFKPVNVVKQHRTIGANGKGLVDTLSFPTNDPNYKFIVGYFTIQTIFSAKRLTDHFVFKIDDAPLAPDGSVAVGQIPFRAIFPADWPADESW